MKILFIGSSGVLSITPLAQLYNSNHTVSGVATNDISNNEFSAITIGSIQSFAFDKLIPLINLNDGLSSVIAQIEKINPDVLIVSCYANLLPQQILSLSKLGAFNLHPSLLPSFRGPTPLFWQFRDGISDFGVTLHRMDSEFDKGNIVATKKIEIDDGINIQRVTKLIANVGSQLVLDFLDDLSENKFSEIAQNENVSSYQSFPTIDDYRVDISWTAKRIYNFIKAYHEQNVYFLCEIAGKNYNLVDVISYQAKEYSEMDGVNYVVVNDTVSFVCGDGYIQCKIKRG